MKLNLEYYISKESNIPKTEYKVIEKFVSKYKEKEYEEKMVEIDSNKLQHFSTLGQNILNWYSFKENSSVLEIGGNLGELTGILCQNSKQVITIEEDLKRAELISKRHKDKENLEIIVGDFDNIDFKGMKFDYITLIGSLPYVSKTAKISSQEFISKLDSLLKPDGKLLIAVDNRFGMKYFAGNPDSYLNKKFVTLLNYNNEPEKIETYTRQKLIDILDLNNYKAKKFYYPLPDYRIPNIIFSDLELPKYNNIGKYIPNYSENSTILIDEIDLFREVLKENENMFTFFANSFLIEASKEEFNQEYKFISYNNVRKPQYRLITKIGNEYVDKERVDENSINHYNNIISNLEILKNAGIKTLDEIEESVDWIDSEKKIESEKIKKVKIKSKYVEQEKLLSVILNKKLEENNLDEFYKILDNFFDTIKKSSDKIDEQEKTIFEEYNIELSEEYRKELNFLKHGLWDMTLKNCFYINDEFYFFDQEWKSDNMPAEYILYRSIIYTISLRRFIDINDILVKYGLEKYLDIFQKLDEKLQEEIRENKIWKYFSKNRQFDIDKTKEELINLRIRNTDKDQKIKHLENKIDELENKNILVRFKRKVSRWIRRKK